MEKVRVFTETIFHGSFGNGRGEYYILLECIDKNGVPRTKEKYARYKNKTKNEVELIALTEILKSFKRKCEIELHMKKGFISETIKAGRMKKWQQENWKNKKGEDIKNSALWKEYIELSEGHEIEIVTETESEYSRAMRLQLQTWLKLQR